MDDLPRRKLIELVGRFGRDVAGDARRCEALLRDMCPQHRREISVLVSAAKDSVGVELLGSSSGIPKEVLLSRLTKRLHDEQGIVEDFARWAVESWALALGIIELAEKQPPKQVASGPVTAISDSQRIASVVRQNCPACGRSLKISEKFVGKQVPCPACKQLLQVLSNPCRVGLARPATQHERPSATNPEPVLKTKAASLVRPRTWFGHREPYTQSVDAKNKGCFLFLLDQSCPMEEPLGISSNRKCDELVAAINGWLQNMAIGLSSDEGIKDWIDIGVFGYRTDDQLNPIIESALQGRLAGRKLASISEIGAYPARIDTRTQYLPDKETGETFGVPCEMPVWVDPRAEGGRPMCHALYVAHQILSGWIAKHPRSFPPVVLNISSGESQDGNPVPYADALKALKTEDGNVLFFNCYLSMTAANPFNFPATDEQLPDALARISFHMSNQLPDHFYWHGLTEGFTLQPKARGVVLNAYMEGLIRFLIICTQAPGLP